MADMWSKAKRSQVMAKILGKNTKPEILMRRIVQSLGYRYRLHLKSLPGKPDIVIPDSKLVVFVNGCFWHYHGRCREGRIPSSRRSYWQEKLLGNRKRDAIKRAQIRRLGWRVLTVWECQIEKKPDYVTDRLISTL